MGEPRSPATPRGVPPTVTAELTAAGFEDAWEIGRGGFGVVYRCRQQALDRFVAVKVLTAAFDRENLDRFLREQRAMGRVSGHPNIVTVFQAGTTDGGVPYIVMQYHPRDSLDALIRREGPLGWEDTLRLGIKMAGALETAHRLDILHRDVKPANILLTEYGDPQLTDFGIAHLAGALETTAGTITGSPAFTAPEVLSGDRPSPASDVYSLGATLFCALTGHAPFERREGEHVIAQFLRITNEKIPDLLERSDIPGDVSTAIATAMSRSSNARPATAADFGQQLRDAARRHDRPIGEPPTLPTNGSALDTKPPEFTIAGIPTESSPQPSIPEPTPPRTTPPPSPASNPRGIAGKAGNLPLELTSFIGRRTELTQAKKLLSSSRLVTFTGIGGVGKTRLALRLADSSRRAFSNGVWLIELGEVRDPMLVIGTVSTTLGIRRQTADPPLEVLTNYLATKQLLLVLDNCEHLVESVAVLAETLLQWCPDLKLLATSREPLGTHGEVVMRVPPLTMPSEARPSSIHGLPTYESVSLFVERATSAVPDFQLIEQNEAAVAEICRHLDGLPLAIELAAVRLRAMSVQQILDRLADRYQLLTAGSRVTPTRQQTLRWCIDWSYELCNQEEKHLWALLSVFSGGFELDAVEGICGEDFESAELFNVVASLVDKSILIREEPGTIVRYRLLETIRDYGQEKSRAAGDFAEHRLRHRDWYQQLVIRAEADWVGPRQLEWITRLDREHANLREALTFSLDEQPETDAGVRMAAALFPYWLSRGHLSEGRLWLDRALARHSKNLVTLKALYSDSVLAGTQGDTRHAAALLAAGDEIVAEQGSSPWSTVFSGYAAGCLLLAEGDPRSAVEHYEKALLLAEGNSFLYRQIGCLFGLGLSYVMMDDSSRALTHFEKILAVTERHHEVVYRGRSSMTGGWALWRQGHTDRAVAVLTEGLRLTRAADDPAGTARCLQTLAWIEADEGRSERATVLMGAAEGIFQDMGGPMFRFLDELEYQGRCERRARSSLGTRKYDKHYQRGLQLGIPAAVAYAVQQTLEQPIHDTTTPTSLTRREQQVADLVAEGLTNRAIATKLVISPRTAQGHVEHILTKLGFTSRAQISAWVVEQRTT
ncbi:protein kinase domain-containing protein [Rhodococcus opacus]|uniref:protein kinase domain-containing protein n=1 Tax=Rhodococcus opacus TaxID=37919 RepID=UPI002474637B|nr:protein kinase [Rhodococcus opacus]MDH6292424.1 putative ATPase/DNA-binding CsgD family transcriptional regulator [Rhodococcus opacus]